MDKSEEQDIKRYIKLHTIDGEFKGNMEVLRHFKEGIK